MTNSSPIAGTAILVPCRAASDAIEVQLAHVVDGIRGIDNRSDYIERRTELVDEWADWLTPTLHKAADIRDGRVNNPIMRRRAA